MKFFKHNDMADLERLLMEQQKMDKKVRGRGRTLCDVYRTGHCVRRIGQDIV